MPLHSAPDPSPRGNTTGIVAMIASMAAFVSNDTCVKLVSDDLPLGEIILIRNSFATLYVLLFAAVAGGLTWPANPPYRVLAWRTFGEVASTILFLSGLLMMPLADATAIGQLTPIAITAAAALILKERSSWQKWLATLVGFLAVLLIVRPGSSAFEPAALLILGAVAMVVLRDLLTRVMPPDISTLTLTALSSASGILAGLLLLPDETWVVPPLRALSLLGLGGFFLMLGFGLSVIAMRYGEVAVVSPFRYAIIAFALALGWLIWRQWPDPEQLAGIGILVAAGLYVVRHDRGRSRAVAEREALDVLQN